MKSRITAWAACWLPLLAIFFAGTAASRCWADRPVVPGTGERLPGVGDDFEDARWEYVPNDPKASSNMDKSARQPLGQSINARVFESAYRGHPDIVRRVRTPDGGLSDSRGAMLLQTLRSGVPGRVSHEIQQDDFMVGVEHLLGGKVPPSWTPSFVVRVYLPPFDKWENRTGPSLGIRLDLNTLTTKKRGFIFTSTYEAQEPYWPGFFLVFNSKTDGYQEDSAYLLLRADENGHDFRGPDITQTGWWTFGMSVTPDGQVHYYASPGVDALTEDDYLASQFPYGFRAHRFNLLFFNVVNQDDGCSWSTPWIIDDVGFYFIRPNQTASHGRPTARGPVRQVSIIR